MQSDQTDLENTPVAPAKDSQSVEINNAKSRPMMDLSDSDSDIDLDNDNGDNSYLAGLNVPDRLKNILRYKSMNNTENGQDDNSDSDDDGELFMRTPVLPKTPTAPSGSATTPTITASTTTRLPPVEQIATQQTRFQQLLARAMASDNSSDDDDTTNKKTKKRPTTKTSPATTKAKGRKPQKKKETATKKKKAKSIKVGDDSGNDDNQGDGHDSDGASSSSSSDDSIGTGKKKKKSTALALLQDSDESDSDGSSSKTRKPLSRKAKMEMQMESQRMRRDAHAKVQSRVMRKNLDSLFGKMDTESDDTTSRSPIPLAEEDEEEVVEDYDDVMKEQRQQDTKAKQSPSRVNIYNKYKKQLQKLEAFSNNSSSLDDSDDDGLVIVQNESRGTKFMKTLLSASSPEQNSRLQQTKGKPSSPLALRTLNQRLMARMSEEQQTQRREMEKKAKAMGVYLSAEERATKHLEREQEAAVLDLEVQQLLYKKAMQQQQTGHDDDDGDYEEGNDGEDDGDDLVFSGEEDDDDEDKENDKSDDSDDDEEHVVLSRRAKSTMKQKNPFLDDDEDDERGKKGPKAPEPAHSIANFFNTKTHKNQADGIVDDATDEPKKLSRLMQRTTIEDETVEAQEQDVSDHSSGDDNNGEHQEMDDTVTEQPSPSLKAITSAPKKLRERNDYVEEEAEEEDDEFFGLGGPDIAETADLDQFEEDGMLVQDSNNQEKVDSSELQAAYHKNMLESDKHMVERLIKDITSGGLRRKRAAAAAGILLDDYDLYDDDDAEDLVALRMASALKRKKFMDGDNIMKFLASDPKTAPFAKAAIPAPGEFDLSGDEMEENNEGGDGGDKAQDDNTRDINQNKDEQDDSEFDLDDANGDLVDNGTNGDLLQHDHSDESDEEMKVNIDMVVGDIIQPWARHSAAMDTSPTHG